MVGSSRGHSRPELWLASSRAVHNHAQGRESCPVRYRPPRQSPPMHPRSPTLSFAVFTLWLISLLVIVYRYG